MKHWPKTVEVLSSTYRIEFHDRKYFDEEEADATCRKTVKVIALPDYRPEQLRYLFMHELCHAICDEVDLTGDAIKEEDFCVRWQIGFITVCKNNPWLKGVLFKP